MRVNNSSIVSSRIRIGITAGSVLVLAGFLTNATAQDRPNPFVKPPSYIEQKAVLEEETKRLVREMQDEVKKMVMHDVQNSQVQFEANIKRQLESNLAIARSMQAEKPVIAGDAPISNEKSNRAAVLKTLPEGATFISCVNGKALYRGKDNSFFQIQNDMAKGVYKCS